MKPVYLRPPPPYVYGPKVESNRDISRLLTAHTVALWIGDVGMYYAAATDGNEAPAPDFLPEALHRLDVAYERCMGGLPDHPSLTWEQQLPC